MMTKQLGERERPTTQEDRLFLVQTVIENRMDKGPTLQRAATRSKNMNLIAPFSKGLLNVVGQHLVAAHNIWRVQVHQANDAPHRFHSRITCSIRSMTGRATVRQS
jgi:hypothetical protein